MEIVGIIGTIVVVLGIVTWGIVYYILKKRSQPTYTTKHGCKIYCQECDYMKEKKVNVEKEIDRFMEMVDVRFELTDMTAALKNLSISFKNEPFPPEGWVATNAKLLSGVHIPGEKRVVVYVPKDKDLNHTALCHEMLHYVMLEIEGISDPAHQMREYWKLIGE